MTKKDIFFYLAILIIVLALVFALSFSGITTRSIDSEWADNPENNCVENWTCFDWTSCNEGVSLRKCVDYNACSENKTKVESKVC